MPKSYTALDQLSFTSSWNSFLLHTAPKLSFSYHLEFYTLNSTQNSSHLYSQVITDHQIPLPQPKGGKPSYKTPELLCSVSVDQVTA